MLEAKGRTGTPPTTVLKALPALFSAVFVFIVSPSSSLFYVLMIIALILCGLGDIGMEHNLLAGLGMFLLSHIVFTANFITHGLQYADNVSFGFFAIALVV